MPTRGAGGVIEKAVGCLSPEFRRGLGIISLEFARPYLVFEGMSVSRQVVRGQARSAPSMFRDWKEEEEPARKSNGIRKKFS